MLKSNNLIQKSRETRFYYLNFFEALKYKLKYYTFCGQNVDTKMWT